MRKYRFFAVLPLFVLAAGFLFPSPAAASDQIRSAQYLVGAVNSQVSSNVNFPFSVYIGDDLQGVSDPVKSAYFTISGVYTGSGTVSLTLEGDATTTEAFILPAVSGPTAFEIIYNDAKEKISPTTAGAYSYNLDVAPSGVVISGLGVKLDLTYQFASAVCPDGDPLSEKMKSAEYLVGAVNSQVSSNVNFPFSVYIGDDLQGVSDPVKSAYFTISGVYTGSGTVSLTLEGDATTTEAFILPAVSGPTAFEIIYNDAKEKISPTTAGAYSYDLDVAPSGVVISGLGVKLDLAYRYQPPVCGVSYPPYGDLSSAVFDSTASLDGAAYNALSWRGALGGTSFDTGRVLIQLAASDNSAGPWVYLGPSCLGGNNDWYDLSLVPGLPAKIVCHSLLDNKRYFRYRVRLCSSDCLAGGPTTPQVDEIIINWSP